MAYFNNSIRFISFFYPTLLWKKNNKEKKIYLTFDDGPIPVVTDFVLEQLERYDAKATFFCVGENVEKNNREFKNILQHGHTVGNHTYNHLKGWSTSDEVYLENVKRCDQLLYSSPPIQSDKKKLFRPPYGKIKNSQIRLLEKEFEIVMWNVLTGDFDAGQTPEKCLKQAIFHTRPGSIIIFHDSLKAEKNLRYVLPLFLEYFSKKQYKFCAL